MDDADERSQLALAHTGVLSKLGPNSARGELTSLLALIKPNVLLRTSTDPGVQ
jgi:hypothetical protein